MRRAWLAGLLWSAVACGPVEEEPEAPFIALDRDFKGFREWESFALDTPAPTSDTGGHDGTTRRVFLNRRPAKERTTFPVGTILVKVAFDARGTELSGTHAMVKRGDGFNAEGATDWEWFELGRTLGGLEVIAWRGTHPPKEGEYQHRPGQGASGDCNSCHQPDHNDAVLTPALSLSSIGG